jgi:NAD(P)H-dependent FMN reductase
VFVTPEYNYGMAPALLNALEFLFTTMLDELFRWANALTALRT